MTTKQKFIEDARRAGITDPNEIVKKANEYKSKFGDFEPEEEAQSSSVVTRDIPEEIKRDQSKPLRYSGSGISESPFETDMFSFIRKAMAHPIALARTSDQNLGTGGGPNQTFQQNLEDVQNMRWSGGEDMGFVPKVIYGALTDPASLATGPMGASYKVGEGILGGAFQAGKQGLKEGLVSAGIHQAENAGKGEASLTGGLIETGLSTLGMPIMSGLGAGLRGIKNAGGAMADAFRKVSSMGGTGEKTVTKSGFQLTPGQMNPTRATQSIEFEAQTNPFLEDIPKQMGMQNRELLDQMMAGNIKRIPSATGFDNVPSVTGKKLEDALRQSKQGVTETYKQGSEKSIENLSGLEIPMVEGVPKVQQEVAEILNKYTYGPEGSARIGEEAINTISKRVEFLKKYKTPKEILDAKKNMRNEVDFFNNKGVKPLFNSAEDVAFKEVYNAMDNAISESFNQLGDNAKYYNELWKATNKKYAIGRTALESIEGTLGVDKEKVIPETYMKRISGIGAGKLQELKQLSMDDADLKPVFEEIQGAFFDNFLNRVSNRTKDDISFDKMISEWNGMDAGVKDAMMPKKVIEDMNEIVSVLSKQKGFGMWDQNPSGTAIVTSGSSVLKNPKEWVMSMIMRGPVQDYYQKGHVDALRTSYQLSKKFDKVTKFADNLATKSMFKGLVKNYDKINPGVYSLVRSGLRSEFGQ